MFKNIGKKETYKESLKISDKHYIVMWDYQPIMIEEYDEEGEPTGKFHEDPTYASWMQETFFAKPTIEQIKKMILENINKEIDKKILNGFSWGDESGTTINVYLSSENQFNYKAAYDLAYQTDGQSLPFILKFGEQDNPQYYRFDTLEKFTDFYTSCINFINTTLQEGWNKKDAIDWEKYDLDESKPTETSEF